MKNFELDGLFKDWSEESENNNDGTAFTRDGILKKNEPVDDVEDRWYSSRKRILFLLKDQPTEWDDDLTFWLKDKEDDRENNRKQKEKNRELKPRFIQNIANLFWGLYTIDNPNDCDYSKAQSFEDVKRCFNTIPFALVESKKQGGGTSITDTELKKYLERYKTFLRRELDILSPNMIVCTHGYIYGFVIDYYNEKYPDSPLRTLEGHNSIRIHPESKTLIFCSYHPSALRFSYETVYMGVMDHYRAFLKSEYFHHFKSWYD